MGARDQRGAVVIIQGRNAGGSGRGGRRGRGRFQIIFK